MDMTDYSKSWSFDARGMWLLYLLGTLWSKYAYKPVRRLAPRSTLLSRQNRNKFGGSNIRM